MENTKVALIILDGLGLSESTHGNAVHHASMPVFKNAYKNHLQTKLSAQGLSVGLPDGQMGNSEVGHLNIGAGRIVYQSLTLIDQTIKDKTFFNNISLKKSMLHAKNHSQALHLIGLSSYGGVHSSMKHLYALITMAHNLEVPKVYLHTILDGRDTNMNIALEDITELDNYLKNFPHIKIASVTGRFYAMDRDKNYDRTEKFYKAIVSGEGHKSSNIQDLIKSAYDQGITDEFLEPHIIINDKNNSPIGTINTNDSIIIFNFRPDRVRQITEALGEKDFKEFSRPISGIHLTTFTQYHKDFHYPIAFEKQNLNNTLAQILDNNHISQLRAAETEKYAHVTFFFNAMKETPYPLEHRILTPSLKVPSYDLAPEMSAQKLTDQTIEYINHKNPQFVLLNYANPDMVGHSGSFDAVVKALQEVDQCLGQLLNTLQKKHYHILITADHGNAEQMINTDNSPCKTHTFSPVPFIFIPSRVKFNHQWKIQPNGILADIAPTVLFLFGIKPPSEMTGHSLITE